MRKERGPDLIGHCGPVTDVAALDDFKDGHGKGFVVSGSTDGSIRLWGGKHEGILWSVQLDLCIIGRCGHVTDLQASERCQNQEEASSISPLSACTNFLEGAESKGAFHSDNPTLERVVHPSRGCEARRCCPLHVQNIRDCLSFLCPCYRPEAITSVDLPSTLRSGSSSSGVTCLAIERGSKVWAGFDNGNLSVWSAAGSRSAPVLQIRSLSASKIVNCSQDNLTM